MATAAVQARVFKYERPSLERGKATVWLCNSDVVSATIQLLKEGGENNLHSHSGNDGFWFVLSGRARFYGEGDVLLADLGKHEGILVPRGFKYWFESASDEPLEILRVGGIVRGTPDQRTDYTPQTAAVYASKHVSPGRPERTGAATVSEPPAGWAR